MTKVIIKDTEVGRDININNLTEGDKPNWTKIGVIVAVIAVIVAIIAGWQPICDFFDALSKTR